MANQVLSRLVATFSNVFRIGKTNASVVESTADGDVRIRLASNITQYGTVATNRVHFHRNSAPQYRVSLTAPTTIGSDVNFELPAIDGTNRQFIKTNGSGQLAFDTVNEVDERLFWLGF